MTEPTDDAENKPTREELDPPGMDSEGAGGDAPDDEEKDLDLEDRKKDYSGLTKVKEQLAEIYTAIVRGFDDKQEQNATIDRAWDIYNCVLNENQMYSGESEIYLPLVRDAVEARVTRFCGQLFPQNNRFSDVIGLGGDKPFEIIAMLDNYVSRARLRTVVAPALLREGDCSGQYSVYLDWARTERNTVRKVQKHNTLPKLDNMPIEDDVYDDRQFDKVHDERPDVMVIDARNLVVLPASVDEVEDAEIVALAMWMSKKKIKKLMHDGVFEKKAGEALLENFGDNSNQSPTQPDTEKKAVNQAGVKMDSSGNKRALVFKAWAQLKVKGETRRFEMHFGGEDIYLSCKRLPFWNDKVPVLSVPQFKVPGSIWGPSPVAAIEQVQYQANDAVNIGMDSAPYSLLPIIMTDPQKNPKIGSMIIAQAAIWETNPNDTKAMEIPAKWQEALQIVAACKDQIMQSMGVNPAMMPHASSGKKPSQAQIAQEQQVALESTASAVSILEESIFSRMLEWFYDLDYQFRTEPLTVMKYGQMGLQATMEQIPVFQVGAHYVFQWMGTESNKAVQQVQQMIAAMNVMRGIPPQLLNGRKIDLTPIIEHMAEVAFGPRLAPKVVIDQRHMMTVDPLMENELMAMSFPAPVSPMDNDVEHLQAHKQAMMQMPQNTFLALHINEHMAQMQKKAMEASGAGQGGPPQGAPGVPGGAGPGVAGTPRMGAQPGQPMPQQPPGAVHKDQMPMSMPRRAV